MTKQALRQRLLERLRKQPKRLRLRKSLAISRVLRKLHVYRKAKTLLCYVAIDGEVETRPILLQALADGKRVAVPVTLTRKKQLLAVEVRDPKQDLCRVGPYGIPEPRKNSRRKVASRDLDLVVVPAVAFDRQGRRLGRGAGYFDRFLERLPAGISRVGLAFHFQVVKKMPWEFHDQPVGKVITERGLFPKEKR